MVISVPMKSIKSRRVEWALGGLFLLPFAMAKDPLQLHPSVATRHVRSGGIAEQKGPPRRRYFAKNASTSLSETERRSGESSFIKRSRPAEPSLPNYPPAPMINGRRDRFTDATLPHVTEPESDVEDYFTAEEGDQETEQPHEQHEQHLARSPIIYQFFGRSRSRVHTADSIPFILLGPTVDHWKTVGQTLASRGFSVMACELDEREKNAPGPEHGKNLILAVLDALRWNRAILVGCDSEAALAIEAAIQLAPDRVKGLVLCGDLSSADQLARRAAAVDTERLTKFHKQEDRKRHIALDSLLNTYLECPYTLVWDGDVAQAPKASRDSQSINMNSGDMFSFNRCLILGGGTAPHRRRPEQFAWALTRFVEEKVAPRNVPLQIHAKDNGSSSSKPRSAWRTNVPGFVESMFSQGSLLVTGRVVASVIFYVTAMKIAVYQYDSLRGTAVSINSVFQYLSIGRQRVFQSLGAFMRNPFIVFSVLGRRRSKRGTGKQLIVYKEATTEVESMDEQEGTERSSEFMDGEEEGTHGQPPINEENHTESEDGEDPGSQDGESKEAEPPQRLMLLDLVVV